MAKQKDYGFKTPVRRSTNNITGNKVGGNYSGGECKIVPFWEAQLIDGNLLAEVKISANKRKEIFHRDLAVLAIGGFFYPSEQITINFEIEAFSTYRHTAIVGKDHFEKVGLSVDLKTVELDALDNIKFKIEIQGASSTSVRYWGIDFGFIDYKYFENNDVFDVFFNSKKTICYPEQFFFGNNQKTFQSASTSLTPLIIKSCNRCQRFLPINHISERKQLSFSNHCSTKAPCSHGSFSNYKIESTFLDSIQLELFIKSTPYTLFENSIISYFGHQLECKACKKFFVNSALNHLRTSTQHREDSLRRRAFELLIRELLGIEWIYHSFRKKHEQEFDKFIWEKFGKKCFNCEVDLSTPSEMDLDHTMPLSGLYPLDETATCLCPTCNSSKSDLYPKDFYSHDKLIKLSELTKIPIKILNSNRPNQSVIDRLEKRQDWLFNDFLQFEEYTRTRDGKRVADSITHSLQKVINNSQRPFNLGSIND